MVIKVKIKAKIKQFQFWLSLKAKICLKIILNFKMLVLYKNSTF